MTWCADLYERDAKYWPGHGLACPPSSPRPADSSGLRIWVGLKEAAWLWFIEMWPVMRATAIPGSVPSVTVKGQPALGQFVAIGWVGVNWKSVSEAF